MKANSAGWLVLCLLLAACGGTDGDKSPDGGDAADGIDVAVAEVEVKSDLPEAEVPPEIGELQDVPEEDDPDVEIVADTETHIEDLKPAEVNWCPEDIDCDDSDECTNDYCVPATGCVHDFIQGCCPSKTAFGADFEGDSPLAGFVIDSLVPPPPDAPDQEPMIWNVTDARFHSPSHALYFGDPIKGDYDNGYRVAATAATPPFQLQENFHYALSFWAFLDVEEGVYSDFFTIFVVQGENRVPVWSRDDETDMYSWTWIEVNLTPFNGNEVFLEFVFDSHDEHENGMEGIYLDDILVEKTCVEIAACGSDWDCPSQSACAAGVCQDGVCSWPFNDDCCLNSADCEDWDGCTIDKCTDNVCLWQDDPDPECCNVNDDCLDEDDVCTKDVCKNNMCVYLPSGAPGCCTTDEDCDDFDECTADSCVDLQCVQKNLCCVTDVDCNDGDDVCTEDLCVNDHCLFKPTGGAGCCAELLLDEGFESGEASGWIFDSTFPGLMEWEVQSAEVPDGEYALGVSGGMVEMMVEVSAVLPVGEIPPVEPMLTFRLRQQMEDSGNCSENSFAVKFNGQAAYTQCNTLSNWLDVEVPLDDFAGETGTLSFELVVDPWWDGSYAVYVDSVQLTQACCSLNDDCDDSNPCTTDVCPGGMSICEFQPVEGCCLSDGECDDSEICTIDQCQDNSCTHINQCCDGDEECDDGDDVCTADQCIDSFCVFVPSGEPGCCDPDVYDEGFESGGDGDWEFSSDSAQYTWHVTDAKANTGSNSLYFGNATATGYGNSLEGVALSPWMEIPAAPTLTFSFWLWQAMEEGYDELMVYIVTDESQQLLGVYEEIDPVWTEQVFDITSFGGKTVRLKFLFDSDSSQNEQGPFVDDLHIEAGCCNDDSQCDDGSICTIDSCPGENSMCAFVPIAGCCVMVADCDDEDPCTVEACVQGQCEYQEVCCESDEECDDSDDVCTDDLCVEGMCEFQPTGVEGCCFPEVFLDDFESGTLEAYTIANEHPEAGWQLVTEYASSGSYSLAYTNGTVDSYGSNSTGTIWTPEFVLPDGSPDITLSFKALYFTESCCDDWSVHLEHPEGELMLGEYQGAQGSWQELEFQIGEFSGQPVRVKFYFDSDGSIDDAGVFIDDLTVLKACCNADAECDDGDPCTLDSCPGANSNCMYEAIPNCCVGVSDCDDGIPCTIDKCIEEQCVILDECCEVDGECNDGDDVCTDDTCADGFCLHLPTGEEGCCVPLMFDESFETGVLTDWEVSNSTPEFGWRISDAEAQEGSYSLYYGNEAGSSYGNGNNGTAISPPLEVPETPEVTLQFHVWVDTESDYDEVVVSLISQAGEVQLMVLSGSAPSWSLHTFDILEYAGQQIQLKFQFGCDGTVSHTGVFFDKIGITQSCCSQDTDCDDGNPCTTDSCPGSNSFCGYEEVSGCCLSSQACDDLDDCTMDVCTGSHECSHINVCCETEADCDDGDDLCTADSCVDGFCLFEATGAEGCCIEPLFADDFSGDLGWEFDSEWERGQADSSSCAVSGGEDPSSDHTASDDEFLAGVVIGGCASTAQLHPHAYATSPAVFAADAPALHLSYWRWLNSDYAPYMSNIVEVFDGDSWHVLWETGTSPGHHDEEWHFVEHDISDFAADGMRVRFGFDIDSGGVFASSSWNLDDVRIYVPGDDMCCQHETDCEGLNMACVDGACQ